MRPEILFPLFAPSASLKGVGQKLAPLLERLAGWRPRPGDRSFAAPDASVRRVAQFDAFPPPSVQPPMAPL